MGTGKLNTGVNHAMDLHPIQGAEETLLLTSCYRNRDKLWPDGPLGLHADFTFTLRFNSTFSRFFDDPGQMYIQVTLSSDVLGLL